MRPLQLAFAAVAAVLLLAAVPTVETVGGQPMGIDLPDQSPPKASLILVPGGSTLTTISSDGDVDNKGNFVMRIRQSLVSAGYAIGYVNNPADLRAAIARMRTIARPVYLLATSNGTLVSMANAAKLGADGPDGLILTSTVSRYDRNTPVELSTINLGAIGIPTLFVHNTNDRCSVAPPSGDAGIAARFKAGTPIVLETVTSSASSPVGGQPPAVVACGPFSPHGYLGIEADVLGKIEAWLQQH